MYEISYLTTWDGPTFDDSGRLPIKMRGLTSLHTLRAADNDLTGPIPSDMGKMLKLEYV